jgi:penicillin-binding protein 1A
MSYAARKRRQRRAKGGATRVLLVLLVALVTGTVVAGAGAVGYVASIADDVDLDDLKPADPGANSVVFAADGTKLGYIDGPILRQSIRGEEMGRYIRQATVAVEDRRFYQHGGVDVEGVARAAIRNVTEGANREGASTLEMQLIRNLYTGDRDESYKRKIREAKLADQLEKRHPGREGKEWVLTKYLDSVPYGNARNGQNIIGVAAAARVYFNKRPKDLTLAQAATIAGLPQAPSDYNPFYHPDAALKRRNDVLRRMAEQGYIGYEEAAEAQDKPLGLKASDYYTRRREQFVIDYVRAELIKKYGANRVREGGMRIYTTISLKRQQLARAALAKNFVPGGPASALVSINPKTGDVTTMASTASYADSKYNLVTQSERQPGSTFKTVVLMAALRAGIDPDATSYTSVSGQKLTPDGWAPKTFSGKSGGTMSITKATLASDNSVYAQLDLDVGPQNVTKAARLLGITSPLQSLPAESLGGLEHGVNPLEMARAYSTIANGGKRVTPRIVTRVELPNGRTLRPQNVKAVRTFSAGVASKATEILAKNVQGGTGRKAVLSNCPSAGKTGTTDNAADAWFAGFTKGMTTVTWVGYPKSTALSTGEQGGGRPAQTWHDFMASAVDDRVCGPFPKAPFQGSRGTGEHASGGSKALRGGDDASGTDSAVPGTDSPDPGAYEQPLQDLPR